MWAALYPSDTLGSKPATHALCAGLRQPVEDALPGVTIQLPIDAAFKLLRNDVQCLSTASTVDQAAEMQKTTSRLLVGKAAMWAGSEEDKEFQEREKERAPSTRLFGGRRR